MDTLLVKDDAYKPDGWDQRSMPYAWRPKTNILPPSVGLMENDSFPGHYRRVNMDVWRKLSQEYGMEVSSFQIISYHIILEPHHLTTISYYLMSISYLIMSCHLMLYHNHIISCHIYISYHIIPCHIIPCHIISNDIMTPSGFPYSFERCAIWWYN